MFLLQLLGAVRSCELKEHTEVSYLSWKEVEQSLYVTKLHKACTLQSQEIDILSEYASKSGDTCTAYNQQSIFSFRDCVIYL
jgi:hypothetical protein